MKTRLWPTPKRIEYTGGEILAEDAVVSQILDSSLVHEKGAEAYCLVVNSEGIQLSARSNEGLRWGRATLQQLQKNKQIPCLRIDDSPRFCHRGVMLDISRNRVPTMATLTDLVDKMSAWKMNHLQLYVEHTLAYVGHEEVWKCASPLTLEDLSSLDQYCQTRGIALNANQNCLGHFEKWLRHPAYAPLGERQMGQTVRDYFYLAPNTLCPTDPKAYQLIDDLLGQLLPRCSGEFANIGCDEPWDLGSGRSQQDCANRGKGAVFSEYVSRVAELAKSHKKKPQFWCDPHPNEDDGLPKDIIALIWGYEGTSNFSERVASHRKQGRSVWVAPGTSCWNSFTGRTWNRRANLQLAGAETEADGILCTAWGDNGHRQAWPLTLMGFAEAAQTAWTGSCEVDENALGERVFGSAKVGPWLSQLGNLDKELCQAQRPGWGNHFPTKPVINATALWKEMHTPLTSPSGIGDIAAWEEVKARVISLRKDIGSVGDTLYAEECRLSLDLTDWTVDRALWRRYGITNGQRKDLALRMTQHVNDYRVQWLERCRYGEMEESLRHYAQKVNEVAPPDWF